MRILRLYFVSLLAASPVISDEDIADVVYEGNYLKVTLQFTITNRRAAPTLEVSPLAVSLGSVQNASSSTFTVDITLHYNINYTLTITASNCAGSGRQHINFLRGTFHMLQLQSNYVIRICKACAVATTMHIYARVIYI